MYAKDEEKLIRKWFSMLFQQIMNFKKSESACFQETANLNSVIEENLINEPL